MSQFKPDQTLEQRLKQIRVIEIAMYIGWIVFLGLALLNYYKPDALSLGRGISYILTAVVILQMIIWKLIICPILKRKAQVNLPDS